jgi:hypothetical protein
VSMARAISQLHQSETDLADEYGRVADRHAVEHDVYHMCHLLAEQCRAHAEQLRPFVERYGARIGGLEAPELWQGLMGMVRRGNAELLGRTPATGPLLLRDLRQLYLLASEVEINWWMVRQGAMAVRDSELAGLFETCHEQTWNQLKWIKTRLKEASPQVLASPT